MRFILLVISVFIATAARAEVGDIQCTAEQFEVTKNELKDRIVKPLVVETRAGSAIRLSVDIGERAYVLAGDLASGDFLLTQAWGPDYTYGMNATGSFTSSGRMQISVVENTKVFKLQCIKTQAADFPRE